MVWLCLYLRQSSFGDNLEFRIFRCVDFGWRTFLYWRNIIMALINCPECNHNVSDKAETCPHCGVKLQVESTPNQIRTNTMDKGKLLFSTKDLYNSGYLLGMVLYIVLSLVLIVFFAILDSVWFGIIFSVIISIVSWKSFSKANLLKQSYVELYENIVSGISSDKNYGYQNGTTFSINYIDITHIDDIANHEIIIHTTHGDYRVQAFNCADKVKNIIQNQKQSIKL